MIASASLRRGGRDVFPGREVTALGVPGAEQMVVARGAGAHIWDMAANEYIDYLMGSGAVILGHAHPSIVEAVRKQLPLGSTFYAITEPAIQLAAKLTQHVPCAEMVQFCTSGSEATFYALRLARAATGRSAILKFEGGFHGSNDYAQMSVNPRGAASYPQSMVSSAGIPPCLMDEVLVAPFNDLEWTEEIIGLHHDRIAAIIVEPCQRAIAGNALFLTGLREMATRYGIVLVFDEIVTGFRLGLTGAQGLYGVTPDLACLGKIIGGGFPLAAVVGARSILELASREHAGAENFVYFSGTLNGSPVSAAAGLAAIRELEKPGVYEQLFSMGDRYRACFAHVFEAHSVAAQVIGVGPMFQVFLTDSLVEDYRSSMTADLGRVRRIARGMFGRGVFFTGEKAYLSCDHSDSDLDHTALALEEELSLQ